MFPHARILTDRFMRKRGMALQEQYFREHARALVREMEFKVYGHAGRPVLAFPSQDGRFFDFKNNGMIDCIAHLIEAGRVQVFCCDSIDRETWSAIDGDGRGRIEQHERWFRYVTEELAVRILDINQAANGGGRAGGHPGNRLLDGRLSRGELLLSPSGPVRRGNRALRPVRRALLLRRLLRRPRLSQFSGGLPRGHARPTTPTSPATTPARS